MVKILFITHNTSRSGAPLVLLKFLEWLSYYYYSEIEINVLAIKGGDLDFHFNKVSSNFYFLNEIKRSEKFFKRKIKKLFNRSTELNYRVIKLLSNKEFDLIYANTIESIPIAVQIKSTYKETKIIAHIHELDTVVDLLLPDLHNHIMHIDSFITVSELNKKMLTEKFGVNDSKIDLINAFSIRPISENKKKSKEIKLIGGSGNVDWRKGCDLFISLANTLKKLKPDNNLKFIWLGNITSRDRLIFEADIKKAGLSSQMQFVGSKESPEQVYKNFDVFILSSREDPFPLAAIEAGQLGIPVLCFEKGTGIAEVFKNHTRFLSPYLDMDQMAKKIIHYNDHPNSYKADRILCKKLFSKFIPENQCPKIKAVIDKILTISDV